jgi:hypothetical protein
MKPNRNVLKTTTLLFSASAAYVRTWMLYSATQNQNDQTSPFANVNNFYFGAIVGYTFLITSLIGTTAEVWDHSRPLETETVSNKSKHHHGHSHGGACKKSVPAENSTPLSTSKKVALKIILSALAASTISAQIYADYRQFSSLKAPPIVGLFTAIDCLYLTVVSGRHLYLHIFGSITQFMESMTFGETDTSHWKTIAAINLIVHMPGALLQANRISNPIFQWVCATAIAIPEVVEHSDEWLTKGNIKAYLPPYNTCSKALGRICALGPWAILSGLSMCAQNAYYLSHSIPEKENQLDGWTVLFLSFTAICILVEFANGYISATNHAVGRWIGQIKQQKNTDLTSENVKNHNSDSETELTNSSGEFPQQEANDMEEGNLDQPLLTS